MRRVKAVLIPAIAAFVAVPLFGAMSAPANAADGAGCVENYQWTTSPASSSSKFNASIDCNGVWALQSLADDITVKGQYYKNGAWQNSSLKAKKVTTTAGHAQIIGQTVDGRRLRGHQVGGSPDLVRYKY